MKKASGKKVKIVGFSQGGMIGRWVLRFWPDTRSAVDEVIALDASNHGTFATDVTCTPLTSGCAPAVWQQASDSEFMAALNSPVETFAGIDYTSIYTPTDELVTPNFGPAASSALFTGAGRRANISTADVCPLRVAGHLTMGSIDAVGYALVTDALDHDGRAAASRIDRSVCLLPIHEGVNPLTVKIDFAKTAAGAAAQLLAYPPVAAEPPLRGYVFD